MDSWPTDDRIDHLNPNQRKAKGHRQKKARKSTHYPHLEYGALQAVTLQEKSGRLEWTSIVKDTIQGKTLRASRPVTVFPPIRPPPLHMPRTTMLQRTEQGAHFLRTHFPDVDIAAELIRDEIAKDIKFSRNFGPFDPYAGNLLEALVRYDSPSKGTAFLAFPMGELNRELNISPLIYMKKGQTTVFKPSASPVRPFTTPIQQLVSSKPSPNGGRQNSYLAVRTFGSTSLFEIEVAGSSKSIKLADLSNIVRSDVGNNPVVDIILSPSPFGAVIVNDHGAVFKCSLANGQKQLQLVHPTPDSSLMATPDCFWQLALDENRNGCLLASNRIVRRLDFRTNVNSLDLFLVREPGDMVTCIEACQTDHIARLSSTSNILWIDERYPRKPLLSYQHGRQFDRSLQVQTLFLKNVALTCLTSRNNGLVTVYDVSRSDDRLIRVNTPPYCFSSFLGFEASHVGKAFIRHPSDPGCTDTSLFRLDQRGSICRLDLNISEAITPVNPASPGFEWSADVKSLNIQAAKLRPDIGPLASQDLSEVDLSPTYDKLFCTSGEKAESTAEEDADAVYELLENISSYWQESNAPVEHMLTTYDIVFRAGDEPGEASRADFLTQCIVNSAQGYRASTQGRLSAERLKKHASWHYNIAPILRQFDRDISRDSNVIVDNLRRSDLIAHPELSAQSLTRVSEAREQLALDLVLSSDVFSPQPFSKPASMDLDLETMARATETLSLDGEPPPIDFGYIRPIRKDTVDHYSNTERKNLMSPLGVRLLLKDWEVGTEPHDFIYRHPYGGSTEECPSIRRKPTSASQKATSVTNKPSTQAQRPPSVVASNSIQPPVALESARRLHLATQSQGSTTLSRRIPTTDTTAGSGFHTSSQDFMTSTQILPGPHGGRPFFGKKKPTKKRVEGF